MMMKLFICHSRVCVGGTDQGFSSICKLILQIKAQTLQSVNSVYDKIGLISSLIQ